MKNCPTCGSQMKDESAEYEGDSASNAKSEVLQELIDLMSGSMGNRMMSKKKPAEVKVEIEDSPAVEKLGDPKDEDEEDAVNGSAMMSSRLRKIAK